MRRLALISIVIAALASVDCGDAAPPSAPTPPPTPPPAAPLYSISGVVREGWTQLPLGGVTVSTSAPVQRSTTTGVDGRYSLPNVPAGLYTISLSKPLFRTRTYPSMPVSSDIAHEGRIGLEVQSPFTLADLTGNWVGHGPYRDEPLWLLLFENRGSFEGMYHDRTSSSYAVSGTRNGNVVLLRIDVGSSILTFEGDLRNERCIRGVIKNEALGGNFPITLARGAPEFCSR
jgi:hypothetical protein